MHSYCTFLIIKRYNLLRSLFTSCLQEYEIQIKAENLMHKTKLYRHSYFSGSLLVITHK